MFEGAIVVREFIEAYGSRDIVKLVRWLEKRYRETIAPIVREHMVLWLLEETSGEAIGKKIGQYFVNQYESCSYEQRDAWKSGRWLHHGALGELLMYRGTKKHKPFIVGLGRGLCLTDLQDKEEWHTPEYFLARRKLEKMR